MSIYQHRAAIRTSCAVATEDFRDFFWILIWIGWLGLYCVCVCCRCDVCVLCGVVWLWCGVMWTCLWCMWYEV